MILSEQIAAMIEQMLTERDGTLELRRNELAGQMGCVPSQINYVITSRFTPARGYRVESRRGGGGYVRIVKLQFDKRSLLSHYYTAVGEEITERDAAQFIRALSQNGAIDASEEELMRAATAEATLSDLSATERCRVRARLMRAMLLRLAAQ